MALEFVILVAFLLFIFLGLFTLMSYRVTELTRERVDNAAFGLKNSIIEEIEIAQTTLDSYSRILELPKTLEGVEYTIEINEINELVITYGDEKSTIAALPEDVADESDINIGKNVIKKQAGIIYIEHLP